MPKLRDFLLKTRMRTLLRFFHCLLRFLHASALLPFRTEAPLAAAPRAPQARQELPISAWVDEKADEAAQGPERRFPLLEKAEAAALFACLSEISKR